MLHLLKRYENSFNNFLLIRFFSPGIQPDGKFRIPTHAIESVTKNRIGLKGPLATRKKIILSNDNKILVLFF
jgi:hypothetical protein